MARSPVDWIWNLKNDNWKIIDYCEWSSGFGYFWRSKWNWGVNPYQTIIQSPTFSIPTTHQSTNHSPTIHQPGISRCCRPVEGWELAHTHTVRGGGDGLILPGRVRQSRTMMACKVSSLFFFGRSGQRILEASNEIKAHMIYMSKVTVAIDIS